MSTITKSTPPAAQDLLEAIAQCDQEITWKDGTYLHPKGKIVFQDMVTPGDTRPDGTKWVGDSPMYLIVYNHPRNDPGMCDAHWFEVDTVTVTSQPLLEVLQPVQNLLEASEEEYNQQLV
jgi:hypothetical protein